ncbi:thioredoxin domain-containing protein [Candidatus Nomurabacteria bacterium]|nr:thioredoxin domain-containing protein [Candidatus Nomurabacteria bacterium]
MNQNKVFIPLSIVVAGLIVAGAVFFTKGDQATAPTVADNQDQKEVSIKPVSSEDHILGNPDADVLIVEYSDFECPYCADFHPTMEQIMSDYGASGKVAWVFRHFPLDQIHKKARAAAEASECVSALTDKDNFWNFGKEVFENQEELLSAEGLKSVALSLGVDESSYDECVANRTYQEEVENDYQDGLLIAQSDPNFGTPYSIVISKTGVQASIVGAQPYSLVKQIIDTLLEN